MNDQLKKLNILRYSKYNIGKKIYNHLWFHKDYVNDILTKKQIYTAKEVSLNHFEYTIIRHDIITNDLTFIYSPDFDSSNEPIVGQSITSHFVNGIYHINNKITKQSKNPLIYHHKWLFVKDDYIGFNVAESKKRSVQWKSILGINRDVSSRIGRQGFWCNWLNENNMEK
jgi:hypothetical protein